MPRKFQSVRLKHSLILRALLCSGVALLALSPTAAQNESRTEMQSRSAQALHDLTGAAEAFEKYIRSKDLLRVHGYDTITNPAVNILLQGKALARSGQEENLALSILVLSNTLTNLHNAIHEMNQAKAEAESRNFASALEAIQRFYPEEFLRTARAIPDRYICPMHPEVNGLSNDKCPKCGMAMEPAGPFTSLVSSAPTVTVAGASWSPVLSPGRETRVQIRLRKRDGTPLLPNDLLTAHTQKIHILIIDESLTDYHHEHPQATGVAGEYAFRFTPRKSGTYRIWIDLLPWETGRQEYVTADLSSPTPGEALADRTTRNTTIVDGLTYRLILDNTTIRAGKAVRARLRITNTNGTPFTALEPVMGAFAHLVGFKDDRKSVLHSHPLGLEPSGPEARGGPEMEFYLYSVEPGFIRLFAQVQIQGAPKFASFGVTVVP
jgi:hypothetical protein